MQFTYDLCAYKFYLILIEVVTKVSPNIIPEYKPIPKTGPITEYSSVPENNPTPEPNPNPKPNSTAVILHVLKVTFHQRLLILTPTSSYQRF